MKKILFVCSGNTCRSPMARAIFSKLLAEAGNSNFTADSAGLYAQEGLPASRGALKALQDLGLDLSGHQSKRVSESLAAEADLILTMTRDQKEDLAQLFPQKPGKVYTLGQFIGQPGLDITDPYGQDINTYRKSSMDIWAALTRLVKMLLDEK